MQTLSRRRVPPDEITLCDALQREEKLEDVGGRLYIASLINHVPTSAYAEYYAAIIARMAIARRAVHAAGQIAALAYNELTLDTPEFRRTCMDLVLKATQDHSRSRAVPLSDILHALQEETYNRMEGDLEAHLLLPGFQELDQMLVGLERGDLIYLAARPRLGKSGLGQAMLLNMARQLARTGGTCDYVTLEMTSLQQARRMVASESQINSKVIRAGFRDVVKGKRDEVDVEQFARFTQAVERLREEVGDVVYVQEEGLTVEQLRDHLTEVTTTRDCRLVVVDQLDLFAGPGGRETEQEHVSVHLESLEADRQRPPNCRAVPGAAQSQSGEPGRRAGQASAAGGPADERPAGDGRGHGALPAPALRL